MTQTLIWCFLIGCLWFLLGYGTFDIVRRLNQRSDDDPPDQILIIIFWPVVLVICGIAGLDSHE